ncbi:type IV pilus assembly protein PilM [bacterium]|nr:type IV pilus assembly protein PilM [bacterium]
MRKAKHPIGVDIGTHSVKVVQMRRVSDGYELESVAQCEIWPDGNVPEDPAAQRSAKTAALKRALEEGQIKARHAVSALCGESIIVRYLQLPRMPEDELRKALQWEAEEYIPFRLNEVNIDSMILGEVDDAEHAKMDVLLVSAKKDLIEEHVGIIRDAGLEPRVVDVDSFAFLNCFETNYNPGVDECLALINIGSSMTSINIYGNGRTRFSRDIPIGGDTITTAIRSRLNCSWTEAERLKLEIGAPVSEKSGAGDAPQAGSLFDTIRGTVEDLSGAAGGDSKEATATLAIGNILNNLISEARRSVEFFESQYRGQNVGRVVLGGGTARLRNLTDYFESELRLPVEIIDPLKRVRVAPRIPGADQLDRIRHLLGVSIGLGIRGAAA